VRVGPRISLQNIARRIDRSYGLVRKGASNPREKGPGGEKKKEKGQGGSLRGED